MDSKVNTAILLDEKLVYKSGDWVFSTHQTHCYTKFNINTSEKSIILIGCVPLHNINMQYLTMIDMREKRTRQIRGLTACLVSSHL